MSLQTSIFVLLPLSVKPTVHLSQTEYGQYDYRLFMQMTNGSSGKEEMCTTILWSASLTQIDLQILHR